MPTETYRGVIRDGMVVLLGHEQSLAEGTEVIVTPLPGARGTPAAVLAAMESSAQVPAAWVDELESLISEGRRPPTRIDPFQESP